MKKRKIKKFQVLKVFGAASVGLLVLALFIFSLLPIYRWFNAFDWMETPCTVIESKMTKTYDKNPNPSYGKRDKIGLQFLYQYEIGGKSYSGKRLDFISRVYGRSKPDMVLGGGKNLYPMGKPDVCFVNPDDHAESVFRNQFPFGILTPAIALTLFLAVGIRLLIKASITQRSP